MLGCLQCLGQGNAPLWDTEGLSFFQSTDDLSFLFALAKYRRILKALGLDSEAECPRTGESRREESG